MYIYIYTHIYIYIYMYIYVVADAFNNRCLQHAPREPCGFPQPGGQISPAAII